MTYNKIIDHIYNLLDTSILLNVSFKETEIGLINISCYGNDTKCIIDGLSKSNILIIDGFYSYFAYYKIRLYNLDDVYNISI